MDLTCSHISSGKAAAAGPSLEATGGPVALNAMGHELLVPVDMNSAEGLDAEAADTQPPYILLEYISHAPAAMRRGSSSHRMEHRTCLPRGSASMALGAAASSAMHCITLAGPAFGAPGAVPRLRAVAENGPRLGADQAACTAAVRLTACELPPKPRGSVLACI